MHEVPLPLPPPILRLAFLFTSWSAVGNASRSLGRFVAQHQQVLQERKREGGGEHMWEGAMDRGEEGETVGILITLGSRLRALPQQPRHFSRSYSAAKKEIRARPAAYFAPESLRHCLALKFNDAQHRVDSFSNEKTTRTFSPRLSIFPKRIAANKEYLRNAKAAVLQSKII